MTRLSADKTCKNAFKPKFDQNIMLFVRLLRRIGLSVGPASMLDAVEAALLVGVHNKSLFYHALASCLIKRPEDRALFEQAFNLFWQDPKFMERVRDLLLPQIKVPGMDIDDRENILRRLSDALAESLPEKNCDDTKIEIDSSATASDRVVSQTKDFATMSANEMQSALSAIKKLAPYLPRRHSRRWQECTKLGQVAIRAALRSASRQSGLVLPKFQSRKLKARPLVILCDVSGSMEQYSRVLLHFIHSLTQHHPSVYSFLFGTHLTNITRLMRYRDVDEAVQAVSKQVDDWSGGTLIGHNLQRFNREWSRRVMAEGASVIFITDGLDCGPDEYSSALQKLHFEIERLHKSAHSLIWLNPLLRFDGFEPKSQSIRTMLPHVDHFLPMHSLQSIYDLVNRLQAIGRRRSRGLAIWQTLAREAAGPPARHNKYAQMKGAQKNGVVI
jgi:uncharacterized protein with von Willebrand factor type A (vWA) domain